MNDDSAGGLPGREQHERSVASPSKATPINNDDAFTRFDELVSTLRQDCPWDREQTHASLRRHLLEESYETLEAIDARAHLNDDVRDEKLDENLLEELGDLFFQIWFQARIAAERGAFTVNDVISCVHDKLVSRHPHVFGDVVVDGVDSLRTNWELQKQQEKGRESVMDGIPQTLPALLRAVKVQKRAHAADLLVDDNAPLDKVQQNLDAFAENPNENTLGEAIFALVDAARQLKLDPEDALRTATSKAEQAFRDQESHNTSAPAD